MTSISASREQMAQAVKHRKSMARVLLFVGLGIALLTFALFHAGCQPPTDPSGGNGGGDVTQIVIVGPNNSGNGGTTPGADAACAGITGNPVITFWSGNTFSGGKAKVNEILLARVDGLTVPTTCTPTVEANANGQCIRLGSHQTREQITLMPTAAGTCTLDACVNGKCAPAKSIDVIE